MVPIWATIFLRSILCLVINSQLGSGRTRNNILNANIVNDCFDISSEMIAVAKTKNVYRNFFKLDLTQPILGVPNNYAALISSGTFTHGHLGPEILVNLLSLCQDNALLTVGINAEHYRDKGFEIVINELQSASRIQTVKVSKQPIYSKQNETDKI